MPQQRVTLAQALDGYTMGVAKAGGRATTEGSIAPGKLADMIIISSKNLFEVNPWEINKTSVRMTMVGGKVVYSDK